MGKRLNQQTSMSRFRYVHWPAMVQPTGCGVRGAIVLKFTQNCHEVLAEVEGEIFLEVSAPRESS